VVCVCEPEGVEFLEIGDGVVYTLKCTRNAHQKMYQYLYSSKNETKHIIYLPDGITRLSPPDTLNKLRHRAIIIALRIKVVPIPPMDIRHARLVEPLRARHVQSENVQRFTVEHVKLRGCRFFLETRELRTVGLAKSSIKK
jgi:hypothetical protein